MAHDYLGHCELCGRRFDRPGFYDDCKDKHPAPDLAQRIAEAVSREVHSRKGIGWECLKTEIVDEIRDALVDVIRAELGSDDRHRHLLNRLVDCEEGRGDLYSLVADVRRELGRPEG